MLASISIILSCLPYMIMLAFVILMWANRKRIKRLKWSKSEGLDVQFFEYGEKVK